MLPSIFPAFPERKELDIYATMTPAKEVGGDFYDFFMVDDRHLAMVMADVSGKGVPAALFMVIGKTLIKDHTVPSVSLSEVFTEVNQILCESNKEEMCIRDRLCSGCGTGSGYVWYGPSNSCQLSGMYAGLPDTFL